MCERVRMWSGRADLEHVYQHVERHPRLRARKSALLPDPRDGTDIACVLRVGGVRLVLAGIASAS